jgi:hypothetical protein
MFPTLVYRGYGPHSRKGGGYSFKDVRCESSMVLALKDGWFETLDQAIDAFDNPKPVENSVDVEKVEDYAPTRKELEQKAEELGIKFDKRRSDSSLQKAIENVLNELD